METSALVADPENATPENETVTPGAQTEETVEGTGLAESTSQESSLEVTPAGEPAAEDPVVAAKIKLAVTNRAIAEGIEGDFKTFEELDAARESQWRAAEEETREAEVRSYYPALAKTLVDTLLAEVIDVGDGTTAHLTEDQVQKIFPHINEFRGKVRQLETQAAYVELAKVAETVVPKENVAALTAAVGGKRLPFDQWLRAVNENAATGTAAWRKREAEFGVEKETHGREQWLEGNKSPAGQPSQQNGAASGGAFMSMAQIDAEPTNTWMQRPKEERERLLSEAHAAAAR